MEEGLSYTIKTLNVQYINMYTAIQPKNTEI